MTRSDLYFHRLCVNPLLLCGIFLRHVWWLNPRRQASKAFAVLSETLTAIYFEPKFEVLGANFLRSRLDALQIIGRSASVSITSTVEKWTSVTNRSPAVSQTAWLASFSMAW